VLDGGRVFALLLPTWSDVQACSSNYCCLKAGVSQQQLLETGTELLYGQAHSKPLQPMAATAAVARQ
jgi:hypothetical protein